MTIIKIEEFASYFAWYKDIYVTGATPLMCINKVLNLEYKNNE